MIVDGLELPDDVIAAARRVTTFFAENNIKGWRLDGCADREMIEGSHNVYKALVTVRAGFSVSTPTVGSHLLEYATREACELAISKANDGGGYITVAKLYK